MHKRINKRRRPIAGVVSKDAFKLLRRSDRKRSKPANSGFVSFGELKELEVLSQLFIEEQLPVNRMVEMVRLTLKFVKDLKELEV